MTELIVIFVGTVFVNNFVLVRFLGLCPFLGVSQNLEAAAGMSLATAFVLTLSSATAYLLHEYVLVPLDLEYLRTISFILVIAASVQFTEIMVRRLSPLLQQDRSHSPFGGRSCRRDRCLPRGASSAPRALRHTREPR